MDPLAAARMGMMFATRRLEESAARTVRFGQDPEVDLVHETVEQTQAEHHFAASAKIVTFADEMWRSLMDIQKA
jgi:flagellar basal body rod protein FlgC